MGSVEMEIFCVLKRVPWSPSLLPHVIDRDILLSIGEDPWGPSPWRLAVSWSLKVTLIHHGDM